jgi:hypothetical protein
VWVALGGGQQEGQELGLGKKITAVWLAGAMSGVIINPFEVGLYELNTIQLTHNLRAPGSSH